VSDISVVVGVLEIGAQRRQREQQHTYRKLIKYFSIFYKLIRQQLHDRMLKDIYHAFIHSHVLYGIEMFSMVCTTEYATDVTALNSYWVFFWVFFPSVLGFFKIFRVVTLV